jgi:hypothetical protein
VYRYDRVLIDPTPEALSEALGEASAATNKGFRARLLDWPAEDFPDFVKTWRRAAEGQRQWNGQGAHRKSGAGGDTRSAAAVVWWSDPLGRKHCRVVAERVDCGRDWEVNLLGFGPDEDEPRPVLWRVYPEDLYLQERGEERRLWAACRCGAAGTPEELRWMGPWCAACHDRAQEGAPLTRPDVCHPVVFAGHPFWADEVAFGLGGRCLLTTVKYTPAVWVWDTTTGEAHKREYPARFAKDAHALAVSADGATAAVRVDAAVRVWSLTSGQDLFAMPLDFDDPSKDGVGLAFSAEGALLVAANDRVTFHDSATGAIRRTVSLRKKPMLGGGHPLTFSPDGKTLAFGWGDPAVRLWELASGRPLPSPFGEMDGVGTIAFSPDGRTLAAAVGLWSPDDLRLWDTSTGAVKASLPGPVAGLAFSPDGRVLATVGRDGTLRLRDAAGGHQLAAFRWHQAWVEAVAFSPDGRWLATGANEDRVKLWPVDALLGNAEGAATRHRGKARRG